MESLKDHLQHMDEENFTKYEILKHLEELITYMIIGEIHHKMLVMSSSQYIISSHEPNVFMDED